MPAPDRLAHHDPPHRLAAPLLSAAFVLMGALALRLRDPHVHGSWGLCPVKLLTGWDCPGCGGLRAVNDLTHGDLLAAASSNLLLLAAMPFAAAGWVLWVRRSWSGTPPRAVVLTRGPGLLVVAVPVVLGVAFTVLRNTGPGAWLHS